MILGKLLAPLKWPVAALGLLAALGVMVLGAMRQVASGARAKSEKRNLEKTVERTKKAQDIRRTRDPADRSRVNKFDRRR